MSKWLKTWWLTVPEPREQSITWGVVYLLLTATGLASMAYPSSVATDSIGHGAMLMFSFMLIAGVLIATIGGWMEFWKLERLGVILMGAGLSLYASVILTLHFESDSVMLVQFWVTLALIASLVARYFMIWRFDFRPRADSNTWG